MKERKNERIEVSLRDGVEMVFQIVGSANAAVISLFHYFVLSLLRSGKSGFGETRFVGDDDAACRHRPTSCVLGWGLGRWPCGHHRPLRGCCRSPTNSGLARCRGRRPRRPVRRFDADCGASKAPPPTNASCKSGFGEARFVGDDDAACRHRPASCVLR